MNIGSALLAPSSRLGFWIFEYFRLPTDERRQIHRFIGSFLRKERAMSSCSSSPPLTFRTFDFGAPSQRFVGREKRRFRRWSGALQERAN